MSRKSGLADSPFFLAPQSDQTATPPPAKPDVRSEASYPTANTDIAILKPKAVTAKKQQNRDTVIPRHHDTMTPRYHDTTIPRVHGVAIELVRKAVREFGKEAATHRFTADEKKQITDLIYTYKSRGVKTSENEIARIAINFIVEDYRENGETSVLHKILEALNE